MGTENIRKDLGGEMENVITAGIDRILDSDSYDKVEEGFYALLMDAVEENNPEPVHGEPEYDEYRNALLDLISLAYRQGFQAGLSTKPVINVFEM